MPLCDADLLAMSEGSERLPGIEGELARRIAHEVRSPLGVIVGGLDEVGARDDLPRDAAAFLKLARRSAGRLERLVARMEWIAALAGPGIDEAGQPEPLRDVVERGVREAEGYAGRRGVDVSVTQPADAAARVRGARAVQQVVQELTHNAIRFARSSVHVEVELEGEVPRIRVRHDGPALDPERLLAEPPPPHASGLGLGLWLVRELAERLGATLRIEPGAVIFELRAPRPLA
jgi:signal transduction histidine kinase